MKPRFRRQRLAPARPTRHSPFERCLPLLLALIAALPMTAKAAKLLVQVEGLPDALLAKVRPALEIAQYEALEVDTAQAERLCERVPAQMKRELEPLGYYEAGAECRVEPDGDAFRALVQVQPGEPVRVVELELTVSSAESREIKAVRTALDSFGPRVGEVLEEGRYERSKASVMAALLGEGYFDARVLTHVVEVTSATRSAVIRLDIDTGARSRIGAVRFEGSQFRDGFLDRYLPWQGPSPFSSDLLLTLQQRLGDAGYFSQIDIEPELEASVDGAVPIRVQLAPAPRTVYRGGVFVGTDTGTGVRAGYERRWVNDRGHKLLVDAQLAQYLRTLAAAYTMPQPGPNDRFHVLGIGFRDEHTESVDSRTVELVGNEVRQWRGWTRTLGLHLLGGDFTVGGEDGNSVMLYPELGLVRRRGDDPTFVTHGYVLALVARAASQSILSDSNLLQLRADVKWIDSLSARDRLILRGAAGHMVANSFDQLPPQLRFFAGGDRSIRGYGYEAIGPRNAAGEVIGGKSLLFASAEVEHYFNDTWGVATFLDAGDAFTGSHFSLKLGTGVGLRWRSPVGLVRVDVAAPVNDSDESGLQLHLTIGPDL